MNMILAILMWGFAISTTGHPQVTVNPSARQFVNAEYAKAAYSDLADEYEKKVGKIQEAPEIVFEAKPMFGKDGGTTCEGGKCVIVLSTDIKGMLMIDDYASAQNYETRRASNAVAILDTIKHELKHVLFSQMTEEQRTKTREFHFNP